MQFSKFPLHPKSKIPVHKDWTTLNITPEQVAAWEAENPNYNWGIRTGEGFIVVDFDPDKMAPESHQFEKDLPKTYTVITGSGGRHYYYKTSEALRNKVGVLPGVDIRGVGGQVVAPGSIHPTTGKAYTATSTPASMVDLPPHIKERLYAPTSPKVTNLQGHVGVGGRNNYLTQQAGYMQRGGVLTLEGLLAINEQDLEEPLPEGEVRAIYNSVVRYAPQNPIQLNDNPLLIRASDLTTQTLTILGDKKAMQGQDSGFPELNKLLGGGWRLGELIGLSAKTKTGKSTFIHQLMHNLILQEIPVGYASREMTPEGEVLPALLSIEHQENAWLAKMDAGRKARYEQTVSTWPLYFAPGYGYFPLDQVRAWVGTMAAHGVRYLFFDHLHYCLEDPGDWKAATMLTQELKALTLELNVFILLVIQPSQIAPDAPFTFANVKGGAGVTQAVNQLFIMEQLYVNGAPQRNRRVVKSEIKRHPLARLGTTYFEYDEQTQSMSELVAAEAEDPEPPGYGE